MHNITIETERLILRPLTGKDAEAVFEWVALIKTLSKAFLKRRK